MKYYKIIFILLILQACNTVTLSEEEANDISNLQVQVAIEDGLKENILNDISVYLSNGEKRIINPNIEVQLNGKPLALYVRNGNYYDKYPVYQTSDLLRQESYYFEVVLPNGTKHPVAYIRPNKITSKFNFSEQPSLDKDFIISWKNNNMSANLILWKGVHEKDDPQKLSGGKYAESTLHYSIDSEKGVYTVPKLFYEDSLTIANYLELQIISTEKGLINPKLIENSEISYIYFIEKTIKLNKN